MIWHIISILTPIVLAVYLIVTDFVDLYPFNDVSKHTPKVRKWEIILNYPLPLIAGFCNWYHTGLSVCISILIAVIFLLGNIQSWWVPYFFGCSYKHQQRYEYAFGRTIKILPLIKNHPIPNLEHMPVAFLIVLWLIASIMNLP